MVGRQIQVVVACRLSLIMAQCPTAVPNPTMTKLNRAVDELASLHSAFDAYCHENNRKIVDINRKYDKEKSLVLLMHRKT
jgi:hypothetical protein